MSLLYGLHDRDAHPHIPAGGWCVESIALSENPEPPNYGAIRGDINWIIRLNWAHNGKDGTIPLRAQYAEFAKRCADFAARCASVQWFIIGNEPNHEQERPHGVKIEPEDYAACFDACYAAIKTLRRDASVCVAAVAPWDVTHGIDWLAYYRRMLAGIDECDSLAIHGYTHGADPNLIWSDEKVQGWKWHFPVIYQTILEIPPRFAAKPVHVTETDQGDNAWFDRNSGWVEQAYKSISDYNREPLNQRILSLSLYRWRGDKYELHNKPQVMADFANAVTFDYQSPAYRPQPPRPTPPDPQPPEPTPPPDTDDYLLAWDKRLDVRGTELTVAAVPQGQSAWRCIAGQWFDENQAQGRVNVFVTLLDEDGELALGVPVRWFWQDGDEVKVTEAKRDPWLGHHYSCDFAMYNLAPSYGVIIDDHLLSDTVAGMGLGSIQQPDYKVHTCYAFTFRRILTVDQPEPPKPPPSGDVETGYVQAVAGLNVRNGPGTEYLKVGALAYRSTVLYDEEEDGWLRLADGWVSGEYVGPETFAETQPPPPSPPGKLIWPVQGARITQRFGDRYEYYQEHFDAAGHNGIDFGLAAGSPIYATADGVVTMAQDDKPGYGLFVRLFHPLMYLGSLYAHCQELLVAEGEVVKQGQQIATVGSTGNSTGPHLHWELCAQDVTGYINVSYGHSKGRANPEIIMWLLGSPPLYK